jgi:hypothetical protein
VIVRFNIKSGVVFFQANLSTTSPKAAAPTIGPTAGSTSASSIKIATTVRECSTSRKTTSSVEKNTKASGSVNRTLPRAPSTAAP